MKLKFMVQAMTVVAAAGLLAACGGGGSDSDSLFSSGSSSADSSAGSSGSSGSAGGTLSGCGYTDLISSSERSKANECGIQVSAVYGQAASYLASAIATCQRGDKSTADSIYNNQYTKTVAVARSTSEALSCGTASGGISVAQPSTQTYYNFCNRITVSNGTTNYQGSCWGPVFKDDGGCGSPGTGGAYTYVTQYDNLGTCTTARDNWLKTR